jgi:putative two-component system response regulator
LAIVDVYDALSSDRVYRPAFPRNKVEEMMRADSGSHFNPALLEAFLTSISDIDLREAAHERQ